ncbi:hypothetical protein IAI10_20545 [Clostridium sp. 19966]|uniref:hypothetical protein n=1 Tax=Clostridium sp. 19966 TaxID=2768166 RepID=UPI0028DE4C37|nr:hypothetical protein [Clostridium sp. 19966]MDT8719042.1 hypothetical protein [Clostridium sp. 19966]
MTDKGYTEDTAKHISQTAFERINIYHVYNVNNPKYKKPFKINFYLKEDSQRKNGNIIHVNMIYSVEIKDTNNKTLGGSLHVPMVLEVEKADDWYIVTEHEEI